MKKRQTLFESGALDLLKDIVSGDDHGVIPSDLAPDVGQNDLIDGIPYKSENDPDASPEVLAESYRKQARLVESRAKDVLDFITSTSDGSYEAYKNSEYYESTPCSLSDYVRTVKYHLDGGRISMEDLPEGTPLSSKQTRSAYAGGSDDDSGSDGVYKRGEDFDAESPRSNTYNRWVNDYENESNVSSAEETFEDMAAIVKEIVTGVADKRHALIAGDPGIGKTYLVREVAKKYIGSSGKKLFYSSGAMSPSMSSVVPFFFFHRNGEVIILDDNDRIIMKNCDQNTQNFMKAVLDPSALNKPVSVPTTMMKQFQQQLDQISGMSESAGRKPLHIEIDTEALREQRFVMKVDGEIAMNDYLTEAEARELSNMFTAGKRLHERSDEDIDDFFSEDGDSSSADDDLIDNRVKMEPSFIFDSSVIFISNLKLAEISPAVADRCESCEVTLSLSQFMTRLESILGGLCQGAKYSSRPQYIRDWAKENIYVMLQGLVEAYHTGAVLFGSKVNINRKFTFRMFEEFANFWARKATVVAENGGYNLEDDEGRHKVGQQIEKFVLRKMLQYLAQKQAKD